MSNIFKTFVQSAPVKTPLNFGYNENVVIEAIDFNERKRNGIALKSNTFIRLTKFNIKTNKVEASTEINFWNLDHTRDFVKDNFINQFSIFAGIVMAIGGDVEKFESDVMAVLGNSTDVFLAKFLKLAVNTQSVQDAMIEAFKVQTEGKIGLTSTKLKCKMLSNKAGFIEPAADISWILPQDSETTLPLITAREKAIRKQGLEAASKKKSPDSVGKAPGGEISVTASSLASI